MSGLIDVVEQIVHDESFGCLDLSVFVLPSFALPGIDYSSPVSLDCSTHGNFFQCLEVVLDVLIFYEFGTYDHVHVEV